jgi:hypothetical protein
MSVLEVKRTSRLGAQLVRIGADLLHFHSTPSAFESSIGGADLIGTNVAKQASAISAAPDPASAAPRPAPAEPSTCHIPLYHAAAVHRRVGRPTNAAHSRMTTARELTGALRRIVRVSPRAILGPDHCRRVRVFDLDPVR